MKKYFLLLILLLSLTAAFSQKKAKKEEKPPTNKELESMMKELQGAMDEMSPEEKRMMDSMGIKLPSMKDIPQMTDKQIAEEWEKDARLVPKKDPARIAAIPATPTVVALPAFISNIHTGVTAKLSAKQKAEAESALKAAKLDPKIGVANAAISLWIEKRPMIALYLMGKACQEQPANIDNINNYAAMLTMVGAEQAAIPVLLNLNKRFPNNSTVLNNLGQAWFGLGDLDKSTRYLDSAIKIYAYHSQANYTKHLIEESKGNTQGAVDALLRSVKKSHSIDKENKLRQLGKPLSGKDFDFPFKLPQDPLGLEKFTWPAYPADVMESESLEKQWRAFITDCDAALRVLDEKASRLEQIATDAAQKRSQAMMQAATAGKMFNPMPWYAPMAVQKLNYYVEDKDNGLRVKITRSAEALSNVMLRDIELQKERDQNEKAVDQKFDPQIGEGKSNPLEQYCAEVNKVRSAYLKKANKELQDAQEAYIELQRKMINNEVYFSQYVNWPEEFELIKVNAQKKWIGIIKSQKVKFMSKGMFCVNKEEKVGKTKLSVFDDVACKYHSQAKIGFMEFRNDCSRFEGKFKIPGVEYSRKVDSDDHDRLLAASLEVTVGASKGWEKGPVQAEAKAEMTARVEWNDREVTNWEASSEVGVSVGSNLGHGDKSIDIAGIKAQIGMNSSGSLSGKGLLQNLSIGK